MMVTAEEAAAAAAASRVVLAQVSWVLLVLLLVPVLLFVVVRVLALLVLVLLLCQVHRVTWRPRAVPPESAQEQGAHRQCHPVPRPPLAVRPRREDLQRRF